MVETDPDARLTIGAPPDARRRSVAGELAFPEPPLVQTIPIPPDSGQELSPVAHVYSIWERGCRPSGTRHRTVRAVGGGTPLSSDGIDDGTDRSLSVPTNASIKTHAHALGFDLVGITKLGPAETAPYFDDWVRAGYAGEMTYLPRGAGKRTDTRLPFSGVSSAIVVGMNYGGTQPAGPIARYARGSDYHDIVTEKLNMLHKWLCAEAGQELRGKAYVDTGPILERDLARRAGLGWFGKNTNLINPKLGSFFFIGTLLLDLALQPDDPFETDRCGSCTRCLDACPTNALVAPRTLDATRCISYLTIELKGAIPENLRDPVGELVYGCDICQDVCPWNHKFSRPVTTLALQARPEMQSPSLVELMSMSVDDWRRFAKGSPITRTKRRGFLRNVAVALGNRGCADAVPILIAALSDAEPLVRGHAAWALGKIGTSEAHDALCARQPVEQDESVGEELRRAIARMESANRNSASSAAKSRVDTD